MRTLVIIDVQNDFMPVGALPVPRGDEVVPIINELMPSFDLVVATQDWHPRDHVSFADNHPGKTPFEIIEIDGMEQRLWPNHCVQGSPGADFHPLLNTDPIEAIFRKGMDPNIDSYSAFYDNRHRKNTGLAGYLRERGCRDLWFCGLAADICVFYSIKDAYKEEFNINYIEAASRALDQEYYENTVKSKMLEMGVKFL